MEKVIVIQNGSMHDHTVICGMPQMEKFDWNIMSRKHAFQDPRMGLTYFKEQARKISDDVWKVTNIAVYEERMSRQSLKLTPDSEIEFNMDMERTRYNILLLPVMGVIGSIFGTYLTYAEAFIIHQWCPFCLIAFALTSGATFFAFKTYGTELMDFIGGKNGI